MSLLVTSEASSTRCGMVSLVRRLAYYSTPQSVWWEVVLGNTKQSVESGVRIHPTLLFISLTASPLLAALCFTLSCAANPCLALRFVVCSHMKHHPASAAAGADAITLPDAAGEFL